MLQLHGNFGAMAANSGCDLRQARNEIVTRNTHLIGLTRPMRKSNGANTHGEQTGATFGAFFIVSLNSLAARAIRFGKVGAHGRHDDSVANFQLANAASLKQGLIRIAHETPNTNRSSVSHCEAHLKNDIVHSDADFQH